MDPVTVTHIIVGAIAVPLAAVALAAPKRRGTHPRAGRGYVPVMLVVLATGLIIGAADPAISPFEIALAPTLGPLLVGTVAVARRPRPLLGRPWLQWHIAGMGGSVIGLVTAGLFQLAPPALADSAAGTAALFGIPALVGTACIATAIARRTGAPASSRGGRRPSRAQWPRCASSSSVPGKSGSTSLGR